MAPEAGGFLPHGYCYLWNKPLLVTHVASDLLIGLSYVAISLSLAWLVHRARRDIPFSVAFVAFGLFSAPAGDGESTEALPGLDIARLGHLG